MTELHPCVTGKRERWSRNYIFPATDPLKPEHTLRQAAFSSQTHLTKIEVSNWESCEHIVEMNEVGLLLEEEIALEQGKRISWVEEKKNQNNKTKKQMKELQISVDKNL